jgi:hypothetical protein
MYTAKTYGDLIRAQIQKPLNSHCIISPLRYQKKTSGKLGVSMKNIKLIGILAIILVISGCTSLAVASTSNLVHNENSADAPVIKTVQFPFSTPTPTPSPTPEPTVTPVPTPKPEPTAKPAITINCKSSAAAINLKVDVTGTLTYNKIAIPGASIYLSYSVDSGDKWANFSLVQTRSDGGFGALWIPNATGSYLLCAQWAGNDSLHWINATANLALTPDSAGNVFSVMSNSTISNLAYNSTTQLLSFNTNGTSSTTGYAQVCIPKTLVSDIQTLGVNIDGKSTAFGVESQDDVWVISCLYTQSQQAFTLQIPFKQMLNPATTPWITIIVVIAILIALVATAVVIRRRRKTAATVAALLKQNRPLN